MKFWNPFRAATAVTPVVAQHFHSLSPIEDADVTQYEDALLWALRNRKKQDIKNVALTGPYGSGKSSIIKTFQRNHKNEFSFLNISLATFKEELLDEEQELKKDKPQDKDLLRLIELSILQQIFYHEEDSAIPDSRFKKIRSFKRSNLIMIAASILLLVLCGFNLLAPEKFKNEFRFDVDVREELVLHLISLALFISGAYIILLRSIRLLNSIKISKFKFHDTEIEVDKSISKSILNNHVDELLYFFEVTPYTVVIIEDLDRFQQTEIFTKLRELNLLINNSKKVKRDIVFLYAVRDDMFRDKDRTKFFDFIVPVIPVINSSNSNDMLREVIKSNKYKISEELLDDVSYFIDDMRLLYNIANEFYVYHKRLDQKLPQDKLLGMIVYKNIHPNDFVDLSNDSGTLYKVLNSKETYIKSVQAKLETEIQQINTQIADIEAIKLKDITELRRLYVLEYISRLSIITGFVINGVARKLNGVLNDEDFDHFQKNKASYSYLTHNHATYYNSHTNIISEKFEDIEKAIDPKFTYAQREDQIKGWSTGKTETLKTKMAILEREKLAVRHVKLREVINTGNSQIALPNEKQNLLINILLRNGYIDEDYLDFISIFYEGSISKEDRQFLLNVKSQIALDFDFKLTKIDKLVGKINQLDFNKDYILNYNLIDFLLRTKGSVHRTNAVLEMLSNESKRSLAFIDAFLDYGTEVPLFIQLLVKKWENFWRYVDTQSSYTTDRKALYFRLIIAYANAEVIVAIGKSSGLMTAIENNTDFLSMDVPSAKLKSIIGELKIKFKDLQFADAPKELTDFVYKGNYYALSVEMIKKVLTYYECYDDADFSTQNYQALKTCGLDQLITYLEGNIEDYISAVFLNIDTNTNDSEEMVTELLNNTAISATNKEKIISRMTIKITELKNIDPEFQFTLMEASKIKPRWGNLIFWYHENDDELDQLAIDFINQLDNSHALSDVLVNIKVPEEELAITRKFLRDMLAENGIKDDAYEKILKAVPYNYDSLEFEKIGKEKVTLLIDKQKLSLTANNFNYLKLHFTPLHIKLLEKRHVEFVKKIVEFELDDQDLISLFNSLFLSEVEKKTVYTTIPDERIIAAPLLAQTIGKRLLQYLGWTVNNLVLIRILSGKLSMAESVKLFNIRFRQFNKQDVTAILQSWPSPYAEIAVSGKRPLLEHGQENENFANNLKTLRYISKADNEKKGIRISTFKK